MAEFDRAATLTDLSTRYSLLLADAGIAATDTADGLGPVLDQTAALGTGNPTFTDSLLGQIARYLTLDRICDRLAANIDVSDAGASYRLSQEFANAKSLRDSLKATVGWAIDGSTDGSGADALGVGEVVTVSTPFLTAGDGGWWA